MCKIDKQTTKFLLLIFASALVVYVITVAPDVTFTDSGELAAVCTTLGIAHPTGYPLFTLIGYLWTLLPLPCSPVYMLNLLAAIFTASSAALFFLLLYNILLAIDDCEAHILLLRSVALVVALNYAFARTIWAQGVVIEVYSLHLLLMNAVLLTLFLAIRFQQTRAFVCSAALLGLSFANHMMTVLLIPAILFIFFKRPGEPIRLDNKRCKLLLLLILPFSVGLLFYMYLPLRSMTMPLFDWGGVARSWDKFLYHIQGKQYQSWMFSDPQVWKQNLGKFVAILPRQVGWLGLIPLLYGIWIAYKLAREIFWFLMLLIGVCLIYACNYSIHDIETYFITAFIAVLVFTGIGLWRLACQFPQCVPLFFAVPLLSLCLNFQANDRRDDFLVPEYTKIMVDHLQPNAIIISAQWDYWCSAFWYKQHVEGYRPDVVLVEKELLRRTWYVQQLQRWYPQAVLHCKPLMTEFLEDLQKFESGQPYDARRLQNRYLAMLNAIIDTNYGKRPIYLTIDILQSEPAIGKEYGKVPQGLAFRLQKSRRIRPIVIHPRKFDRLLYSLQQQQGRLAKRLQKEVAVCLVNNGIYALRTRQLQSAQQALSLAIRIDPMESRARKLLKAIK